MIYSLIELVYIPLYWK